MTDKERLMDLLSFVRCKFECCASLDCGRCGDLDDLDRCQIESIAEHLLSNGVIVAPMPMATWLKDELTEYVHKRCIDEM